MKCIVSSELSICVAGIVAVSQSFRYTLERLDPQFPPAEGLEGLVVE